MYIIEQACYFFLNSQNRFSLNFSPWDIKIIASSSLFNYETTIRECELVIIFKKFKINGHKKERRR